MDDITVSKYVQFGVNVLGINPNLNPMEIAHLSIKAFSGFLFDTLGLKKNFKEIGIDDKNFEIMAKKSCGGDILNGFKPLKQSDIENILQMCLE